MLAKVALGAYSLVGVGLYAELRMDTAAPRWYVAPIAVFWGPLLVFSLALSGPWWPKEWFR